MENTISHALNFHLLRTNYTGIEFKSHITPNESDGGNLEVKFRITKQQRKEASESIEINAEMWGEGKTYKGEDLLPAFDINCKLDALFGFTKPITDEEAAKFDLQMINTIVPMISDFAEIIIFKMGYRGVQMPRSINPSFTIVETGAGTEAL